MIYAPIFSVHFVIVDTLSEANAVRYREVPLYIKFYVMGYFILQASKIVLCLCKLNGVVSDQQSFYEYQVSHES